MQTSILKENKLEQDFSRLKYTKSCTYGAWLHIKLLTICIINYIDIYLKNVFKNQFEKNCWRFSSLAANKNWT